MEYKYKTSKSFKKDYPSDYAFSVKHKLMIRLCEDMGWTDYKPIEPRVYWNEDNFREECKKYSSYEELLKNNRSAVECMRKKVCFDRIIEEFGWKRVVRSKRNVIKWTKETALENALQFNTRKEWEKGVNSSYRVSRYNGWYDEFVKHMPKQCRPKGYWTLERCMVEALKYNLKDDWRKGHSQSFNGAITGGHMKICSDHMTNGRKYHGYWTKENIKIEALKYTSKPNWLVGNCYSYILARQNGWIVELTKHMD